VDGGGQQRGDGDKYVKTEPIKTARENRPGGRDEVGGNRRKEISCGFQ